MRITINIETDTPPDCGAEYSWHVQDGDNGVHGKGRGKDEGMALSLAYSEARITMMIIASGAKAEGLT
jgi:hypothetical protein